MRRSPQQTVPSEGKMTIDERYEYLQTRQKAHARTTRKERSLTLDQMAQATGLNRKTLTRHMNWKHLRELIEAAVSWALRKTSSL